MNKDREELEKLKWQIHAETSVSSMLMWIIIAKLFGGWVIGLAVFFIFGNITTMIKSVKHLGSDYFKQL